MIEHNSNSNCNFAEQLVSFLYGEIEGAEKSKFEFHLQNCPFCSEELNGFSAVRSSMSEWRSEEFEILSTPVIKLPGKDAETINSNSWLNSLKAVFTLNPVGLSAAVAAVLLIFSGLWFFSNRSVETEVAENRNAQITTNVSTKNSSEIQEPNENETAATVKNGSKEVFTKTEQLEKNVSEKKVIPVKSDVQNETNPARVYKTKKAPSPVKPEKDNEKNVRKPAKRSELPTLAVDEYEDKSLRLSDILDEVSMK